jgi:hypothetical protein
MREYTGANEEVDGHARGVRGEPIGGCATRRMPPRLKRTTCWRNRSPHLDNFSVPCRLAENASAGTAMAGNDQASPGRQNDISNNSISAALIAEPRRHAAFGRRSYLGLGPFPCNPDRGRLSA